MRELPTADEIARAYVAAAREVGDVEALADAATSLERYNRFVSRARWLALAALNRLFPKVARTSLARWLGYDRPSNQIAANWMQAQRAPWWDAKAVGRVVDAI